MYSSQNLPWELEEKVNREVGSDERIEWMEQPIPHYFTRQSLGAFIFAIPWTAFAIFWVCGAAGFKVPDFSEGGFSFFPLFGLPFILVGIGMLSSPLWTYRKSLRTVYVITEKRAIIFEFGRKTTSRSYLLKEMQDISRTEKRDGTGDVAVGPPTSGWSRTRDQSENFGFYNIRNPLEVEKLLRQLKEKAQNTAQ